jgi:hypothetical protein
MIKRLLFAVLLLYGAAGATDTTITRTYYLEDSYMNSIDATTIYSTVDTLSVGAMLTDSGTCKYRTIMGFYVGGAAYTAFNDSMDNVSSVVACTLFVKGKSYGSSSSSTDTFYTDAIIKNWVLSEVTWNRRRADSNWTTAGCGSDGNDYSSIWRVKRAPPDTIAGKWYRIPLTAIMDSVVTGNLVNFIGVRLALKTETKGHGVNFYSGNATGTTNDPYMTITYVYSPPGNFKDNINGKQNRNGKPNRNGR